MCSGARCNPLFIFSLLDKRSHHQCRLDNIHHRPHCVFAYLWSFGGSENRRVFYTRRLFLFLYLLKPIKFHNTFHRLCARVLYTRVFVRRDPDLKPIQTSLYITIPFVLFILARRKTFSPQYSVKQRMFVSVYVRSQRSVYKQSVVFVTIKYNKRSSVPAVLFPLLHQFIRLLLHQWFPVNVYCLMPLLTVFTSSGLDHVDCPPKFGDDSPIYQ